MIFHDFEYSMVSMLQLSVKAIFVFSMEHGFNFYFELPTDGPLRHNQGAQVLDHPFDWLYWRCHIA